jgi:hypothetical protein
MYAFVQEAEADVQRKMAEKYRMDAYNESQKCADARKRLNDSLAVLQLKLNNLKNANGSKRK